MNKDRSKLLRLALLILGGRYPREHMSVEEWELLGYNINDVYAPEILLSGEIMPPVYHVTEYELNVRAVEIIKQRIEECDALESRINNWILQNSPKGTI